VIIRNAKADDAGGIAFVHVNSWKATYMGLMPDHVLEGLSVERRTAFWQRALSQLQLPGVVLVAEEEGQIVGFVSCGAEREGDPEYRVELMAIYLLKEQQGRGTGRRLFSEAARRMWALGFQKMLLWVLETNPTTRFYEHMGGVALRTKTKEIGGAELTEVAYGYDLERFA